MKIESNKTTMFVIGENVAQVKQSIAQYEQKFGRNPGSVRLIAASKGQSVEKIRAAYFAGQHAFGENYLQEALKKMLVLAELPIEWHFIGQIQSNKTRKIAEHFAWVHSIDSMKIAKRLNDQRPTLLAPLNICIEVNVSHEGTKSGVMPDELLELVAYCQTLPKLKLRGLMAIPAPQTSQKKARLIFRQLFQLQQALIDQNFALDTLSMGMSSDYEAAIAEGSTLIRIGTALFGERTKS